MVAKYPQNELARFSLGKALYDLGNHGEALENLEIALAAKPDWMVVQILIGKSQQALGNGAEARRCFERALKLAIEQHHEGPQSELEQLLSELR